MKPRDRAYIQQQIIEQMIESLAQSKASSNGWNWNDLPEEPKTLFDGCPNKNYYRRRVKDVLTFLGSWGLGFYETDDNFPANNRFIPLEETSSSINKN